MLFDKRGSGLSDRVPAWDKPTLEQRMDDISAVMDASRYTLKGVPDSWELFAVFGA
jgi:hypothetical protein